MRPVTVRTIRVTRTPSRMRSTSFAPTYKAKQNPELFDFSSIIKTSSKTIEPTDEAA